MSSVSDIQVILYPELIAAAFKNREADLYICWTVLKAIDIASSSSGHMKTTNMQSLFMGLLGISESQAYTKLSNGIGKYWNPPKGKKGKRTTSIISKNNIVKHLDPTMTKTHPFGVKLSELLSCGGWRNVKALLLSMVAARCSDARPTTYATIEDQTGLSEQTIRRAVHACPNLHIMANCVKMATSNSYEHLREDLIMMVKKSGRDNNPWFIIQQDGVYHIVKRLANSYALPEYERLSYKTRPKELRACDKTNALNCSDKRYLSATEKEKIKKEEKNASKYIDSGYAKAGERGTVFVWEPS